LLKEREEGLFKEQSPRKLGNNAFICEILFFVPGRYVIILTQNSVLSFIMFVQQPDHPENNKIVHKITLIIT